MPSCRTCTSALSSCRSRRSTCRSPQRKGGDLRTRSAGGVRLLVRLSCVAALLIVPLLLLVTPSRALHGAHVSFSRLARFDVAAVASRSAHRSSLGSLLSGDGDADALAPDWALPIVL